MRILPPSRPRSLARSLTPLIGCHARGPRLAALEPALTTQSYSRRVFSILGLRLDLASGLARDLGGKLVHIGRPLLARALRHTPTVAIEIAHGQV